MDFNPDAHRQAYSGALVFPPSPQQVQFSETKRQLEKELAEVQQLKQEMQEYFKTLKDSD